ncbi:extracellular metallo proteinase MEP [Periconia macrospinosa]|uniref:Extracellular metalloproteinase n=1 Tax=Periconia macrospinosa TaxID=97972 RepID=A0A2V1E2M7_9PLEO|nr:extracellular metallo proteinase MEP [Periconia macrospinosa]
MPDATFRLIDDHYVGTNGITHFYFRQTANDVDVQNADFNVNIGRDGNVFSFGHSFIKMNATASILLRKRDTVDPVDALKTAVKALQLPISADKATAEEKGKRAFTMKQTTGTVSEPKAQLVYFRTSNDDLSLSWRIETHTQSKWLITYVDAQDGDKIHHVVNYAAAATYEVYPWNLENPTEGPREVVKDPWDTTASEFGWHSDGTTTYNTTRGNNAIAHSNWDGVESESDFINLPRPTSSSLAFEYPYDPNEEDWKSYINASITQAFYTANKYHDVLYRLGFTEAAGNYQLHNHGKGGKEGDWIYINAQDSRGSDNANFASPPDGQPGVLTMYMYKLSPPPWRDPAFSAGLLLHELTHGLSKRLTGGPANAECLDPWEPGAMGEGTSDFYAMAMALKKGDTRTKRYPISGWEQNELENGTRPWVLSTDMSVNPLVYEDANTIPIGHHVGVVWTTMLWEVLWDLIDKYGKNDADVPEFDEKGVPTDGKFLTLQLVTDAMAMQPCNPSYVQARDTVIDADQVRTGGENRCLIWRSFAKRGLGTGAVLYDWKNRTGSFEVPANC